MSRFDPHVYAMERVQAGGSASDGQLLYLWRGTHWFPLHDDEGEREAYQWLVRNDREHTTPENARRAHRAAILFANTLPTPIREVVVPCRNGYVHLRDGALCLEQARAALGLQYVLNCDFAPEAGHGQRFPYFLERVLPDLALRERVQEYAGYTLTADARHQRAQLWLGSGANGKGVLANILQALHGAVAAVSLDALDGFRIAGLIGASLIYCDEVPRTRINEQLLKSLIAGERVLVDRKYLDALSVHVRGKWLVLGNQLPRVSDHSAGFWRRWDVIPFTVTIPEAERDSLLADDIIRHELSGVLNWALAGLLRLEARGRFDPNPPEAMLAALRAAKVSTNSVLAWSEGCGVMAQGEPQVPKEQVYRHYRRWCAENGIAPMAAPRFWSSVREAVPDCREERHRKGGSQVRVCNLRIEEG